jgi:hypothetical protein
MPDTFQFQLLLTSKAAIYRCDINSKSITCRIAALKNHGSGPEFSHGVELLRRILTESGAEHRQMLSSWFDGARNKAYLDQ